MVSEILLIDDIKHGVFLTTLKNGGEQRLNLDNKLWRLGHVQGKGDQTEITIPRSALFIRTIKISRIMLNKLYYKEHIINEQHNIAPKQQLE